MFKCESISYREVEYELGGPCHLVSWDSVIYWTVSTLTHSLSALTIKIDRGKGKSRFN